MSLVRGTIIVVLIALAVGCAAPRKNVVAECANAGRHSLCAIEDRRSGRQLWIYLDEDGQHARLISKSPAGEIEWEAVVPSTVPAGKP